MAMEAESSADSTADTDGVAGASPMSAG